MAEMTCPICGKVFDDIYIAFLKNGNPVCSECAEKEAQKSDTERSAT